MDNPLNASLFTEARVLDVKREHELRVRRVTNFATMQKTLVLTNRGILRGDAVHVSNPEISEALVDANLVAHVHDGWRSDIVITLDDEPAEDAAWMRGRGLIDAGLLSLARGMDEGAIGHVSVFALTFIPWLAYLGSRLDDVMSVEVFEKHRVAGSRAWCWAEASDDTREFDTIASGQNESGVREILVVTNLTGTVSEKRIPTNLTALPRVVLAPVGVIPAAGILRSKADLQSAAEAWIRLLGQVEALWPAAVRLHVLGPVPASFAVRMGMHRMKTAHAELVVYHRTGDTYQPTPPITD
ncbi:MAG: SAVED domain-containing protein [Nigerium sp.]|nr:SAVED domain-containing protein [Nigerium sp.]